MYCYNCGKDVSDNAKYCPNCGADLANKSTTNYTSSSSIDEEMLKAYVGNNYDNFTSNSFNFGMFFLGHFYLLYRKSYLYFVILLLLGFFPLFGLVFWIVLSICFNKWYLNKAKEDVLVIKHNHPNSSSDELITLAKKKGGTSIAAPLVYGTVMFIFYALIIYLIMQFVIFYSNEIHDYDFFKPEYYDNYNNDDYDEGNEDEYFSSCTDESDPNCMGVIKDFTFVVPNKYYSVKEYEENVRAKYDYAYGTSSFCNFEVETSLETKEDYMTKIEEDASQWALIKKGQYEYNSFSKEENDEAGVRVLNSYYIISKNNNTYMLTFVDYNDSIGKCKSIREKLFEKVNFDKKIENSTIA